MAFMLNPLPAVCFVYEALSNRTFTTNFAGLNPGESMLWFE